MEASLVDDVSSRYGISNFLRYCLSPEHKAVMEDTDRFLFEMGAIKEAINGIHGVSPASLMTVLTIIGNASLGWKKPFEKLSWEELSHSREASGSMVTEISVRSVARTLKVLSREKLIVTFNQGLGYACFYGLHIINIFGRLYPFFSNRKWLSSKDAVLISMWKRLSASPLLLQVNNFIECFENKVFFNPSMFTNFISQSGGIGKMLGTNVRNAKEAASQIAAQKNCALAEQPFYKENGSPNPRAALEFWHKEVRDSELYSGYFAETTGKSIGQMKNWLNELRKTGYAEEDIRKMIHDYTRKWYYVSDKDRDMTAISKKGKPYACRMTGVPDFSFFYANRNNISMILSQTCEPGKYSDGFKRMSIEDIRAYQEAELHRR